MSGFGDQATQLQCEENVIKTTVRSEGRVEGMVGDWEGNGGDEGSEDDWETASLELDLGGIKVSEEGGAEDGTGDAPNDDEDEGWDTPAPVSQPEREEEVRTSTEPMILVDLTKFTSGDVHNKFDRNSNNDPERVRKIRMEIEEDYETFSRNVAHLADRVVIPASQGVYRSALQQLRNDLPGHFFLPVFPPTSK